MRIGLISDIHSNLYGLLSVVEKLQECDVILCAGDITGYYTFVNEVFDVLEEHDILFVRGNHEEYLLRESFDGFSPLLISSLVHTKIKITENNLEKIRRAPKIYRNVFDGVKLEMSHEYNNEPRGVDVAVYGHSHAPSVRYDGGKITINPGSCGQPRDGDTRASCAIFDTENREVKINRSVYDIDRVIEAGRRQGIHPRFINALSRRNM